ncbi:DUF4870 domain-containing protein [Nonomuraea sp. MG754425]|nr:DUF4870 domain-containing protein [Nonomuraea sp. MG754425]
MSQDPPHQPADDDATRRVTAEDLASSAGSGPQQPEPGGPGYGHQPGSSPGYGPQGPSYGQAGGYGQSGGYGQQIPYGQQPGSAPNFDRQPPPGYAPPGGYGPPGGQGRPGYPPPGGYAPPPGHAQGQGPGQPYVPGRFGPRPGTDDTSMAMMSHLLGLLVSWVGPLIIYLMKKDESPYVRDQAAEALNFQITMFIGYLISGILVVVFVGVVLMPIIWILSLIFHIQAAMATNKGEPYRYPMSIRMIT